MHTGQYGCNFISARPTNLNIPNDNFNLETSHVIPALIRKFVEAKDRDQSTVIIWRSGSPKREFMHVDNLADACNFFMGHFDEGGFVNVGTGRDISIKDLALMIGKRIGFD